MPKIDKTKLVNCDYDGNKEVHNPKELTVNLDLHEQLPLAEQVKMYIREAVSQKAQEEGFETEEDANDFDVENDFDKAVRLSGHEYSQMDEDEYMARIKEVGEALEEDREEPGAPQKAPGGQEGSIPTTTESQLKSESDSSQGEASGSTTT